MVSLSFMTAVFISQKTSWQNKYLILKLILSSNYLSYFLHSFTFTMYLFVKFFWLYSLRSIEIIGEHWWKSKGVSSVMNYWMYRWYWCSIMEINTLSRNCLLKCKSHEKKTPSYWSSSWFMHISSPYYTVPDITGSMPHCAPNLLYVLVLCY